MAALLRSSVRARLAALHLSSSASASASASAASRATRTTAAAARPTCALRAGISSTRSLCGEFSDVLEFETLQPANTTLTPEFFEHKAVLVVNTASKCGYTPQLKQLQELHEQFEARGLVVLAVPSNDFGKQEPGSGDEILALYTSEAFKVGFPIAKKVEVTGENAHEFFERIVVEYSRFVAPTWNFDKFLIDHHGDLRAVFPHDTEPLVPQVLEAIEEVLSDLPRSLQPEGEQREDVDDEDNGDDGEDDEEEEDDIDAEPPTAPPSPAKQ